MKTKDKYIVNTVSEMHVIRFNEIKYFEAYGRYTWIIRLNDKILVCKNIGLIEEEVSGGKFARIHHSILVNIIHIKGYNIKTMEVLLKDNTKLPVSRRRKLLLKNKLPLITRTLPLVT